MALGFLGGLSGMAGAATPVMGGIGSLLNAFGVGKPKMNNSAPESERAAQALIMALSEPNNSLVQHETDLGMQRGMNDFLTQIRQYQMADARRGAKGLRGQFFSPERADENIDFLTSRGLPEIGFKAREQAVNEITSRANALLKFAPAQQARLDQKNGYARTAYANQQGQGGLGGMGNMFGGGLQNLFSSLFGGQQAAPSSNFMGAMPLIKGLF